MPDFRFHEWMDAQLRNVPVPAELHARLAANRPATDDELDERVRDVPVPPHLERHLRRIAWHHRRPWFWSVAAMAASVLIVVGLGAYLALSRNPAAPDESTLAKQTARQPVEGGPNEQLPKVASQLGKAAPARQTRPRRQQPITVPLGSDGQVATDQSEQLPFSLKDVATVSTTIRQAIDAKLREQAALGASGTIEQLPQLAVFEPPAARGVRPPRLRGYDMLFQLKQGEHPFVSPAAHKQLRTSRVPLTFRTASYDRLLADVEAGQLPPPDEIRVEDFLAAQRYALPALASGRLAMHTAICPAPLGPAGLHRLQLIVQGGKAWTPPRRPARLIAVVDTSSTMQVDARWRIVHRALDNLGRHLQADDRITLIGFAERPRVLAEDATRAELAELLASDTLRRTGGAADFASAIQAACDAVPAVPSTQVRRVVFITAGRADLDEAQLGSASESLLQLVAANIPWQIVHMSPADDQARWGDLARRGSGRTRQVNSADELSTVLLEELSGRPQTLAQALSMKITFNPALVNSYRMLGHESSTLTGEAGDPLEIDLQAEQTPTCMYELWLKPGSDREIATVEILWRDPHSGQPRRNVQRIGKPQMAASFAQAPAWLQQGILAANTAELLRGSYYVPRSRRLEQLLELTADVDPAAAKTPEFHALVRLLEQAAKLR